MLRLYCSGLALLAAGCSPVKDSSNVPDAAIDATDMRGPMIAGSVPADMSNKVSVIAPISVFFDEPLDPASVNATTVKLGYVEMRPPLVFGGAGLTAAHGPIPSGLTPVRGTVSYDAAARKISFIPEVSLQYGYPHVLQLDVKDSAGLAFTGQVRFMTYINQVTKQFNFNTNSIPTSSINTPVDMNGRQAKRYFSSSPGTDSIWFTPDDPASDRLDYTFLADGRVVDERSFSQGPDARYNTADDVTNQCIRYTYDAQNNVTERSYATAAGLDAMWCTADDQLVVNATYQYTSGAMSGWIYFSSPGTDGTWRNSDDRCAIYYDYEYDAQGRKVRDIYRQCGTDQIARTPDDTYGQYHEYEYDASGYLIRTNLRISAGVDGMWLTMDDGFNFVDRWQRSASGAITEQLRSFGPGPDTMWGTMDDPGNRTLFTYNAQKLVEETTLYVGIGADNMWGTADDVLSNYTKVTYDTNGNRIDQKTYNAGPDGMWKNADDRVISDFDFDTSR